jgi:hypothetical protein
MSSEKSARSGSSVRVHSIQILAVSFAALLLEISYTRVISFKLFYYYTYLVIGLALLGIGAGGVIVAISGRLRRAATDTILMWSFLVGSASVALGYVIVASVSTDTLKIWDYGTRAQVSAGARLLVVCLAIFFSFLAVGVVVATLFSRRSDQIGRLYFADLIGAGLAAAVVVALISWIGPPATIILAGLVLAVTGLSIALRGGVGMPAIVAILLTVVLAALVVRPALLPEVIDDATKTSVTSANTAYSSWSPIFRVDVANIANEYLLFHDGLAGSGIFRYNGNPATLTRFESDARKFPFAITGADPRRVLIIGAAGGNEVLTSLYYHAAHIDAIELNPVTWSLVTHKYAAYDGHLAQNPKVNFVKGDGRSYLARSDAKFQLVWFPAPDSYAANAAAAGAYVLSESYLYTSDAIVDSLKHLSPHGLLAVQFGEFDRLNRTLRYVATARHALGQLGVHNPTNHIIVASSPDINGFSLSTILVKRDPFNAADVNHLVSALPAVHGATLKYAPGRQGDGNPVSQLVTRSGAQLDSFYRSYPFDIRPISDNRPFFWHFTRFTDVIRNFTKPIDKRDLEQAVGERVLLLLLGIAIVLAAVFLLLPFVLIRRTWSELPRKRESATYFALLGFGFIFFEVTLIQRLILFLGYPTYSLTVTLMSILVFTGVGAYLSERFAGEPRRVLPRLFGAITALTVFYLFGLTPLTNALLAWPVSARIAVAIVVLAPLGLCLGMFMPLGIGAVAGLTERSREYVAWGWAVNGFASVIGAVLSTILAMSFGFGAVLVIALVLYLLALVTLSRLLRPSAPPRDVTEAGRVLTPTTP